MSDDMAQVGETLTAKVKRLERENRVFREREQDFEERYQGPADIEGIGGRPGVIILRDKNMGEVKKIIDDLPNIPGLRPDGDPTAPPLGFRRAKAYVRNEAAKMIDSIIVIGAYNTVLVRDRHRLRMWIRNRAGMLLRPDVIGEETRFALLGLVEDVAFAPSVPHLFGLSQETEVQPVEAERKGFG
jgi:hypothetical protein